MTIRRSFVGIFVCLLFAFLAHPASSQSPTQLEITTVSLGDSGITIKGKNFGTSAPTVTISDIQVAIAESSTIEIVTGLPALVSGVYVIQVTRAGSTGPDGTAKTTLLVP